MGSRFHRASSNCIISRYLARFLVQLVKRGVCRQTSVFFGCFSDALPDRWGRTLLKRRYSSGGWSDLQKILRWIINLLSQNVDYVENKRVKCERKILFILR